MIGRQRNKAGAISSKSVPKANAANQIQPRMGHPHPLRYRYSSIAMVEHGGSVNQFCMKDMLANTLLAEAERKDTAFRSDFNAEHDGDFHRSRFLDGKSTKLRSTLLLLVSKIVKSHLSKGMCW